MEKRTILVYKPNSLANKQVIRKGFVSHDRYYCLQQEKNISVKLKRYFLSKVNKFSEVNKSVLNQEVKSKYKMHIITRDMLEASVFGRAAEEQIVKNARFSAIHAQFPHQVMDYQVKEVLITYFSCLKEMLVHNKNWLTEFNRDSLPKELSKSSLDEILVACDECLN